MHLYLAGHVGGPKDSVYPHVKNRLESYAYAKQAEETLPVLARCERVLIDSGAFTANATGRTFTVGGYYEWAAGIRDQHAHRFTEFNFISLDVIGDQERTWAQFAELRALGLEVMPVVTGGCDVRDVDRALEYPYVACGNLTGGLGNGQAGVAWWLGVLFSRVAVRVKAGHPVPRLHLLGMTSEKLLMQYPAYSADSSSWTGLARFGVAKGSDVPRVPGRGKDGGPQIQALLHKREMKHYEDIEARVTAHWARRGITWT